MRMTRYDKNRKKKAVKRAVLILFIVVVPLAAVAASVFFMNIYNKGNPVQASKEVTASNSMVAFKYNYEIGSKSLYRIGLEDFVSFEEAEACLKSIKAKKLNGFIVKEDGYKIIYGVFSDKDEAAKVQESIEAKAKGGITEVMLQGYSLKYNDKDSTFIQLVQATDRLIWDIAKAKSTVSQELALKTKKDLQAVFEEIAQNELKLEKYHGYAETVEVTKEQTAFREEFVKLLEEMLAYRLNADKDYYKVQDSLLNQVEAYRKFIGKLSI